MAYITRFQNLKRSTSGTRRAFAVPPPSMQGVDTRTQSHIANFVSRSISKPCVTLIRRPPNQHQTNTRPHPDTDATDLHEAAAFPTPGRFPMCQSVQFVSHGTAPLPPYQGKRIKILRRITGQNLPGTFELDV
jgi:hypothetical protein